MRPLRSTTEWPKLSVYDIEADDWVKVTLVCHVDEYGNRKAFPTIKAYVDWLFSADFPGDIIWAHAGGHYDNRFIIAETHSRGWSFKTAISGGTIVILTISNGKKTLKFGDSYRLMPDSLKKIGDTVKLPKLDVNPSELYKLTPAEVLEYCYRDCDIVLKGLQLMREKLNGVGADFAFTLASIAARYNRRSDGIRWEEFIVKDGRKWKPHPNIAKWDGECYHAYHGGRCEVFERSLWTEADGPHSEVLQGPFYWYDIVSSYPSSMLEDLPLYYQGFFVYPKNQKNVRAFFEHCGITQCQIYVPPAYITVLPVKDAKTNRLTFPSGLLDGHWTNIEILEALDQGAEIRHIYGQWRFEAKPFLRKFVLNFYKLRQQAKDANDEFAAYAYKILLNSSYGKLVETVERKAYISASEVSAALKPSCGCAPSDKSCTHPKPKIESTATQGVFSVASHEVGPFRHTAAGAYITAFSRLKLFRKALEMHKMGARVLYCDTDSLICDKPMPDAKPAKTGALGEWESVDILKELEIILPKVYRAESATGKPMVYKCKGCPIERKHEDPDMPRKRWEAFKNYRYKQTAEEALILGKDGVTGFVQDVKFGSLHPRRLSGECSQCKGLKRDQDTGEVCIRCAGVGTLPKPLVRSLQSEDKKRIWDGPRSRPIIYPQQKQG